MIVFPRMKHQNPQTKRSTNCIPWELHTIFLDRVVYPAIRGAEGKERDMYNNYCSDEWRWKAALSSNYSGKRKTATVRDVEELQRAMRIILTDLCRQDSEGYMFEAFKSFFFVTEAKAIKATTHHVLGTNLPDPYRQLQTQFPFLQFDELQKRENGQIIMDLGMGFHPNRPGSGMAPVVGMWEMDYLVNSYGAAGMNKPTVYPTNTMPAHGGCQSEMGKVRASLVQLVFRSTYNLTYEAVRRIRGGHDSFCEDSDAYQVNHKFTQSIEDYSKMMQGAQLKDHSHGCREELRGSATAIVEIIRNAEELMKAYSQDHPITWVASKTFFQFNQRRLLALAAIQRRMAAIRPSNYGLTSTLIMHLIRSVCHAPVTRLPHLKRAFIDLSFELNSERFGIFFLHSLDLDACLIADIEPVDDAVCNAYYEKHVKVIRRRPMAVQAAARWTDVREFPLGRTPSWAEWVLGMSKNPEELVTPWPYDVAWGDAVDEVVVSLFIRFTREYLGTLRPQVLMAGIPAPETLEQAMNIWTVVGIKKVVINPMFVPSSSNVPGRKPGVASKSFPEQLGIFFPKPSSKLKQKTVYTPFIKFGYLRNYHRAWKDDQELAEDMEKALTKIFLDLQCLPVTVPGKQLWKVKAGDILFQVNSFYFRLDSIGPKGKMDQSQQGPRAKASNIVIERTILQLYPEPNRVETTKPSQKQKPVKARSGPSKNARIPPIRKKGIPVDQTNLTTKETPQMPGKDPLVRVRPGLPQQLPLLDESAPGSTMHSKVNLYHAWTDARSQNFQVDDQGEWGILPKNGTSQTLAGSTRVASTVGATNAPRPVPHINLMSNSNRAAPSKPVLLKIANKDGTLMTIGQNGSQTPTHAGRGRKITSVGHRRTEKSPSLASISTPTQATISPGNPGTPSGFTRMLSTVGLPHAERQVPHIDFLSSASKVTPGKAVLLKNYNKGGEMMTISTQGSETPTRTQRYQVTVAQATRSNRKGMPSSLIDQSPSLTSRGTSHAILLPGHTRMPSGVTRMLSTVGIPHAERQVPHIDFLSSASKVTPGKVVLLKIYNDGGEMMKIGKQGLKTPTRTSRGKKILSIGHQSAKAIRMEESKEVERGTELGFVMKAAAEEEEEEEGREADDEDTYDEENRWDKDEEYYDSED
ncbi:hypothetical protein FIBSPDRAFT_949307 [Athelia psychrophila]|uniref:Uncharacterized protein n=1 Tax=Athelia psychrophila TaxID=1759441 RepID=A0A166PTA6_9AGAM|nr:hypothetical protein FIBSPDRAFT_949307 [Fibularhizoctonia sp. CBS 109695]